MDQIAFDKGIKRIEKLFGQHQNVYDEPKLTEIYDVVRHLDAEQWKAVVGGVVRTWPYKTLPNISAFEKMKNELGRTGQRTRKIMQDCPTCGGGYGLRAFVYRREGRFVEGWCLCDCPNAENFTAPPHMTIQQARRLPGFKAADRPGAVPHMLEVLNPTKPQEARGEKQGPGVAEDSAAPSTQPDSQAQQETSSPPGTLVDTATELAGKLNGSGKARQQRTEDRDREKRDKMLEDLNDWLSDDEKASAPF